MRNRRNRRNTFIKTAALALMAVFVASCSNTDTDNLPQQETGNVVAILGTTETQSSKSTIPHTSSKDVNRGAIYAWVSKVKIKFEHVATGFQAGDVFTLVDTGGEPNFNVDNVLLGDNEVTAYTATDSDELFLSEYVSSDKPNIATKLDTYKGINPYVLYESVPFIQDIVQGTNVVNINLETNYGRRLSSIRWADNAIFKDQGYAKVSQISSGGVESVKHTITGDDVVYSYWSDNDAVVGNHITLKVEVYSSADVLITTFTRDLNITASTSITCSYIITDDELFETVNGINLIFQEWKEINCTDC